MPSIIMADRGEQIALTDGDTVEASEDASTPIIIVDVAMKSLSSSLAASGVMGATGSSDSRGKSRSPPRAIIDRLERRSPNTPPSRGSRKSGISLAPTPPPRSVPQSQDVVTLVSRQASTASIRSDVLCGLASITAEQASAHVSITMQHHLVRERQDYGPLFNSARSSPRALQVGSMMLQLEDDNPPLVPPFRPLGQECTVMGEHFCRYHAGTQRKE